MSHLKTNAMSIHDMIMEEKLLVDAKVDLFEAAKSLPPAQAMLSIYRIHEDLRVRSPAAYDLNEQIVQELTSLWARFYALLKDTPLSTVEVSAERCAKVYYGQGLISKMFSENVLYSPYLYYYQLVVRWTLAEAQTLECELLEKAVADIHRKHGLSPIMFAPYVKDKNLLFQYALQECTLHSALYDFNRAWRALRAAKQAATELAEGRNIIFTRHMAAIELQRGIILMKSENVDKAYQPLVKAYNAFFRLGAPQAVYALKLLLQCKCRPVMSHDVDRLISSYTSALEHNIASAQYGNSIMNFVAGVQNMESHWRGESIAIDNIRDYLEDSKNLILRRLIELEPSLTVNVVKLASQTGLTTEQVKNELTWMLKEGLIDGKIDFVNDRFLKVIVPWNDERYVSGELDVHTLDYAHDALFQEASSCLLNHEETRHYVTEVRSQGRSMSCTAFAFVDAMHATGHFENHQDVQKASEQELMERLPSDRWKRELMEDNWQPELMGKVTASDCWGKGIAFTDALNYVKKNGLAREVDLPFQEECLTARTRDMEAQQNRISQLNDIRAKGPRIYVNDAKCNISINLAAEQLRMGRAVKASVSVSDAFLNWKPWMGTYKQHGDDKIYSTHALLLVGYGVDIEGCEYFIAKNSWGRRWGHRGFIRIAVESCTRFCFLKDYRVE